MRVRVCVCGTDHGRNHTQPRDREERLDVINRIYEHVSFVKSGDNTLASAMAAVQQVRHTPLILENSEGNRSKIPILIFARICMK